MSHLTAAAISRYLPADSPWSLDVRECVESTNTLMKATSQELPTGAVLIADRQTAGRGRMTRAFFSPPRCGLYISMLLRPQVSAAEGLLFTPAAAVAAAEAIEEVCGISVGIKWVNDLMLNGRKVGGILTESTLTEEGKIASVIVGIGINVYPPREGYPSELEGIAASLFADTSGEDIRPHLCAALLTRCADLMLPLPEGRFLGEYRRRSLVLGRCVTLLPGGEQVVVEEIDDACRLIVRDGAGTLRTVFSGECSLRADFRP
ncbi:MAG: biotin--[Clostridia bacterium]|nr:biotin--[acetyl-CoA-carboxylase] ligase [Clostridia bacterium]